MIDKVPRFRAKRMTDGQYVEGCLIMSESSIFVYILTDENFGRMITDGFSGVCHCKIVRVLEHSIEQIR
mgnify:FL=1